MPGFLPCGYDEWASTSPYARVPSLWLWWMDFNQSIYQGSFPVIMMNGLQAVHMPGLLPCDYDEWISTSPYARVPSLWLWWMDFNQSICQGSFPVIMMNGFKPVHMPRFLPCDYDEWISTSLYTRIPSLWLWLMGFNQSICKGSFLVIMMNGLQPVHMPGLLPCDFDEWISTSPYARVPSLWLWWMDFNQSICQGSLFVVMMNGLQLVYMPGFLPCDYDEWTSTSPNAMGSIPMIMMNGPFKKFICQGSFTLWWCNINFNLVDAC